MPGLFATSSGIQVDQLHHPIESVPVVEATRFTMGCPLTFYRMGQRIGDERHTSGRPEASRWSDTSQYFHVVPSPPFK
jgi:hypothetical protein